MPLFSNAPPDDPRGHALDLKRCPVFKPLVAIVTCHNLIGCPTHFYGGRTVPCEEKDCEPCKEGSPWRWHSYLSCYSPAEKVHFLFENTARATEPFVLFRKAHGTLRGCCFRAHRANGRANGRVYIETKPSDLEKITLPEPPDLEKVLSIIWNIPLQAITTAGLQRNVPRAQVDQTTPSETHISDILKAYDDSAG